MGIKISKRKTQKHLEPSKWNKLISNKKTILLMLENHLNIKLVHLKVQLIQKLINLENFQIILKIR